jgi:hypothetical protein
VKDVDNIGGYGKSYEYYVYNLYIISNKRMKMADNVDHTPVVASKTSDTSEVKCACCDNLKLEP